MIVVWIDRFRLSVPRITEGGALRPGDQDAADPRPAGPQPGHERGRGRFSGRERVGSRLLTPPLSPEQTPPTAYDTSGETADQRRNPRGSVSRLRFPADSSLPARVTPSRVVVLDSHVAARTSPASLLEFSEPRRTCRRAGTRLRTQRTDLGESRRRRRRRTVFILTGAKYTRSGAVLLARTDSVLQSGTEITFVAPCLELNTRIACCLFFFFNFIGCL